MLSTSMGKKIRWQGKIYEVIAHIGNPGKGAGFGKYVYLAREFTEPAVPGLVLCFPEDQVEEVK